MHIQFFYSIHFYFHSVFYPYIYLGEGLGEGIVICISQNYGVSGLFYKFR